VASPILIRDAVPADADALWKLSVRAITHSAAGHYTPAQLQAWAARRTLQQHETIIESTATFVAEVGSAIAGFANVALDATQTLNVGEVDQLFVDPDHGGHGVAAKLLDAVERAARDHGVSRLLTHASWRAAPVFERSGYMRLETESVTLGEQELTRTLMAKVL
jgi:putative acetyltransferase